MRILIDCDGVLADLVGSICDQLAICGHNRTPEAFQTYDLFATLNADEERHVRQLARTQGFCGSLSWYAGARVFLSIVKDLGDVYCVTAPWTAPTWDSERRAWLDPFLPASRVISVSPQAKPLIAGDMLIEDHPGTVEEWLISNPLGRAVLIDRPWNRAARSHPRMDRASTYLEAVQFVRDAKARHAWRRSA